jgi:hypothetical protein
MSVSLDPPLPVYLFNVVSGLRDKSAKGYPIKKVRIATKYYSSALICMTASVGSLEDAINLLRRHTGTC